MKTKYSEAQLTAHHEAAHAVAHIRHDMSFQSVSVVPGEGYMGIMRTKPRHGIQHLGNEGEILAVLAGIAAEKKLRPHIPWIGVIWFGGEDDWKAARIHTEANLKMAEALASYKEGREQRPVTEQEIGVAMDRHLRRAGKFVRNEWETIERIAHALIASPSGRLHYEQIYELCTGGKPTPEEQREQLFVRDGKLVDVEGNPVAW